MKNTFKHITKDDKVYVLYRILHRKKPTTFIYRILRPTRSLTISQHISFDKMYDLHGVIIESNEELPVIGTETSVRVTNNCVDKAVCRWGAVSIILNPTKEEIEAEKIRMLAKNFHAINHTFKVWHQKN